LLLFEGAKVVDLNLHTSIIVVAAILVLLIFVDGLKRMLAARTEQKRLVANEASEKKEGLDLLKAELPNGGARSVGEAHSKSNLSEQNPPYARPLSRAESRAYQSKKTETESESIDGSKSSTKTGATTDSNVKAKPSSQAGSQAATNNRSFQSKAVKSELGSKSRTADESNGVPINTEDSAEMGTEKHVPMLMESVQLGVLGTKDKTRTEQERSEKDPIDNSEIEDDSDEDYFSICATPEDRVLGGQKKPKSEVGSILGSALKERAQTGAGAELKDSADLSTSQASLAQTGLTDSNSPTKTSKTKASATKPKDPLFDDFDELDMAESLPAQKATTTKITSDVGERLSDRPPSEEILVIHVFSKQASGFEHKKLFALFKACDLRLGEMSIFHRFERANAQGKIQFSVADVVKPGSFDPDQLDQTTPGIALFMSLPGPEKPIEAFDAMAEVAQAVARNLDGIVKDEMLSVMTTQTLEHGRQCIHEFNRRQQLAKPSFA
jgi:cell division protein ZipA